MTNGDGHACVTSGIGCLSPVGKSQRAANNAAEFERRRRWVVQRRRAALNARTLFRPPPSCLRWAMQGIGGRHMQQIDGSNTSFLECPDTLRRGCCDTTGQTNEDPILSSSTPGSQLVATALHPMPLSTSLSLYLPLSLGVYGGNAFWEVEESPPVGGQCRSPFGG